jgi:hypothetical protein
MLSVLQNATATQASPDLQTLIIFNLNYALLFLALSGLYMIVTNRKVLFSVRIQDLTQAGNIVHYVVIAVGQALAISAIQSWIESFTHFTFYDIGMSLALLLLILVENWAIQNR